MLDAIGDHAACEQVANRLIAVAGSDVMWSTNGWNHLASAYIGQGRFDDAVGLAQRAVQYNPLPDNARAFAATLARAKARATTVPGPPLPPPPAAGKPRDKVFQLIEAGEHTAAVALLRDPTWRVRRAALGAVRLRLSAENQVDVTPRARAAAVAVLADSEGSVNREAVLSRALALQIREQAYFARDPVPRLGDRMTREAFYQELRARGAIVLGEQAPRVAPFVDRVVIQGSKVSRTSDYIALLRDLAALAPLEALAQFDLDDAGYLEVARAWAAAMAADPTIAQTITAGLAKR